MTIKILMGNAYLTTISQITGLYMNDKMYLRIFCVGSRHKLLKRPIEPQA